MVYSLLLLYLISQRIAILNDSEWQEQFILLEKTWLFSTLCDNFCLWNREMLIG
ncbi:Genome sequencing data, contig C317 (modular protein) [Microcystis aeruginosa PCC 9432]|uniref:Genome sequencing data, contig C317 (Modular protein) n=1 Tax=Microcystis aeruginosa PCC 9432 TaxID=1160280 RepID=A0A822L7P5_MICAE|nr:Genome sequencing data, contig C317 (modular protein) [Microcystis aeruginosa PCC 9432]